LQSLSFPHFAERSQPLADGKKKKNKSRKQVNAKHQRPDFYLLTLFAFL